MAILYGTLPSLSKRRVTAPQVRPWRLAICRMLIPRSNSAQSSSSSEGNHGLPALRGRDLFPIFRSTSECSAATAFSNARIVCGCRRSDSDLQVSSLDGFSPSARARIILSASEFSIKNPPLPTKLRERKQTVCDSEHKTKVFL